MKKFYFVLAMVAVAVTSCQKDDGFNNIDMDQSLDIETLMDMASNQNDFNDDEMLESLSSGVLSMGGTYINFSGEWINAHDLKGANPYRQYVYDGESIKCLYAENNFDDGSDWMKFLMSTGVKYYKENKCVYDRESNSLIDIADNSVIMQILYYNEDKFVIMFDNGKTLSYCDTDNKNIDEAMAGRLTHQEVVSMFIMAGYDKSGIKQFYIRYSTL